MDLVLDDRPGVRGLRPGRLADRLGEQLATRFDHDGVFGTALNWFATQAVIGHPLTVYGEGGRPAVTVEHLSNPRAEAPEHYCNVKHARFIERGLAPHPLSDTQIESLLETTKRYASLARLEALRPTVRWRRPRPTEIRAHLLPRTSRTAGRLCTLGGTGAGRLAGHGVNESDWNCCQQFVRQA